MLDEVARCQPAAVLIDASTPRSGDVIAAIRALAPPLNGTPILGLGVEHAGGAGGVLTPPLEVEVFVRLLRRWAGPLENDALRQVPWSPRYRLIRLLGLEAADAMLLRLREALAQAVTDHAGDQPLSAHRLAGVAGLCGYSELAQAWSRAERGEARALDEAIAASLTAIAGIEHALR